MSASKNYLVLKKNDEDNESIASFASANSGKEMESAVFRSADTEVKRTILQYSEKNNYLFDRNEFSGIAHEAGTQSYNQSNSLDLHLLSFNNDLVGVKAYVQQLKKKNVKNLSDYVSIKDHHGNTPLHLACMLGHLEVAKFLVDSGAVVKSRNKLMWTPLNEAISYGSRDLIKIILEKYDKEVRSIVDNSKPRIVEALREMDDFYVEIKWDFESWIPFISRFLPSDTCKLHKCGTKIRIDCTLGDVVLNKSDKEGKESAASSVGASISPLKWERGDLTFLFDVEKFNSKNSLIFLNNNRKIFKILDNEKDEETDLDNDIDFVLSKEMIFLKLSTKQASFSETQVGWFSKRSKLELVNGYMCQFYDIKNLYIVSKLRVEHLSEDELKKREEAQQKIKERLNAKNGLKYSESFNNNNNNKLQQADEIDLEGLKDIELDMEEIKHRPSLPPPANSAVTWDEYVGAKDGCWPTLGRKSQCKESKKEFKAQIAMSQEFPLTIRELNKLLDALVPLAKFRKLKEFINLKLPPGFPVKIDIPIVPAVSAKVCFQNFQKNCSLSQSLFEIPKTYTEQKPDDSNAERT